MALLGVSQARMGGDCNPNMPAYLSPAAVGHVSRWFALPWCADSRAVAQLLAGTEVLEHEPACEA